MNIYEIKRRVKAHDPDNKNFFLTSNMKFFKQTLKDFKVRKLADGKFLIWAKNKSMWVSRDCAGYGGIDLSLTCRVFDPETNLLSIPKTKAGTLVQDEPTKLVFLLERGTVSQSSILSI